MTHQERDQSIGFVGLGVMGMPMARNLLAAGWRVHGFDVNPDQTHQLVQSGGVAAASPAAMAKHCSTMICMVETTAQAASVISGADGFLDGAAPGDLIMCMCTIDWEGIQRIAEAVSQKGIDFLDAPVAGMRDNGGAQTASLKCFVGGSPQALERARPVLNCLASEITHWGKVGQGTAIKLLNSMVLQANRIVAAEALTIADKAGLDVKQVVELFSNSYANSAALQYLAPRVLSRDFDGIRMSTTIKDVELQTAFGKALGMPMPMTAQGQQVYAMAKAMGLQDEDGAAVIKVYEQWAKRAVA